jgi:hypothetical protein
MRALVRAGVQRSGRPTVRQGALRGGARRPVVLGGRVRGGCSVAVGTGRVKGAN